MTSILSALLVSCSSNAPIAFQRCDLAAPKGVVDETRPHQWFGKLGLLVRNNGRKKIRRFIVDLPPWRLFGTENRDELHHLIAIPAELEPLATQPVSYHLRQSDYDYLVGAKWETKCTIVNVTFADGSTWTAR